LGAITAHTLGAFDFIVKRLKSEAMLHSVMRAAEKRQFVRQVRTPLLDLQATVAKLSVRKARLFPAGCSPQCTLLYSARSNRRAVMGSPIEAAPAQDLRFMVLALEEARRGGEEGEVPVGAVLVQDGAVVAAAHNRPIALQDPTAHAEVLVLRAAGQRLGNYRFPDATLYVTMEPCVMCAGALLHARIARLVYGAADARGGGVESLYRLLEDPRLNHSVTVVPGVRAEEAAALLHKFFVARRQARTPAVQG
jgi:tRNA(adenine34) deaminase